MSDLLADLRDLSRPRDDTHTRPAGIAAWYGDRGEYVLHMRPGGSVHGDGGAPDMLASIERHGMRADDWQHETDTGRIMCTLWERDWTLAVAR
jgi:hypothetical protein